MAISKNLLLNAAKRDAERAQEGYAAIQFCNNDLLKAGIISAMEALSTDQFFYSQKFN